jgi:eukaryotic-like serine/threonine-protein kinase
MNTLTRTDIVCRLLTDTGLATEEKAAQIRKAAGDADIIEFMVEKKVMSASQAEKYRKKAQEVEEAPTIPNWTIIRKLGQGGMGAVYKAVHSVMAKKVVAMKVLAPNLANNPDFVARFEREAKSAGALDHPNVVAGVDYGHTSTGAPFFAMEFVDGYSAKDLLEKHGKLKVADAVRIVRDVAQALDHAAACKLIHRDIKPDNIMVTKRDGVVKLADLGLAKQMDDENSMTQTGSGFGTPYYMPPEQARNAKYVDPRSDIYALGATLYHLLTGKVPFTGDTAMEVLIAKEKGTYSKPSALNGDVPSQVNLLVDKMMAKDPAHRFQSAGELLQQIDNLGLHASRLSFAEASPSDTPTGNLGMTPRPPSSGSSRPPSVAGKSNSASPDKSNPPPRPPSRNTEMERPEADEYFLRYKDPHGKMIKTHMPKSRVLHMIKANQLDETVEIATSANGQFRRLAAFPEFEPFLRARIAAKKFEEKTVGSQTANKTASKMADLLQNYDKAASRHNMKKSAKNAAFNVVSFTLAGVIFAAGCWGIWTYIVKPNIDKTAAAAEKNKEETKANKESLGR